VERHDFAVRGKPAQTNQHADQYGHRNGEGQYGNQRAEKNQQDHSDAAGMADNQIHQADQLGNEENESENREPKRSVRADFASDVFIEQAHVCARRF
jgi:hypothetical protein